MSEKRSVRELIELAISIAGSEAMLGELCGYTQAAIWKAKNAGGGAGRVSAELAIAIDRATEGEVSKFDLRPDLWPRHRSPAKAAEANSER